MPSKEELEQAAAAHLGIDPSEVLSAKLADECCYVVTTGGNKLCVDAEGAVEVLTGPPLQVQGEFVEAPPAPVDPDEEEDLQAIDPDADGAPVDPDAEDEGAVAVPAEQPDYSKLNVAQLQAELKSRGLDTKGKKAKLVERLVKDDSEKAAFFAASALASDSKGDLPPIEGDETPAPPQE